MNKDKICIFFFATLFILISCKDTNKRVDRILDKATMLVQDYPDSALAVLDSILLIEKISEKQYNTYILLQTQAKDKADKDIASDSLIFNAKKYFLKHDDIPELALSTFFCGRVLHSRGAHKEAIIEYLKSLEYPIDDNLKGLIHANIGYAHYNHLTLDDAEKHYKKAIEMFKKSGNIKNEAYSNSYIGNIFLLKEINDSAFFYYNKAIDIAKQSDDLSIQIKLMQNIGIAYFKDKQYGLAKEYLKKSYNETEDNMNKAKILLSLGQITYEENKIDSALFYLNSVDEKIMHSNDNYTKTSLYYFLSSINEDKANYKLAHHYNKLSIQAYEKLIEEKEVKSIQEYEKKYNYEVLKNRHSELQIQKQYLIMAIFFILAISSLIIAYFYSNIKKKRKSLDEAKLKIDNFQDMAKTFDEKENTFRTKLLEHFNILKKSALLKGFLSEDEKTRNKKLLKKFNEIVYNQDSLDWNKLYQTMNDLHNNLLGRIRENYPQLDETEFRICCMIYSNFSNEEISIILGIANNSVSKKRSSIRKKLGIEEYGNIAEFLQKKDAEGFL